MERLSELGKKGAIFVGLLVVVFLLLQFSNRMADLTQKSLQYAIVTQTLQSQRETKYALQTKVAYATSDAYLDEVARDSRYVKEGDIPIYPIPPKDYTPEPTPYPSPTPRTQTNFESWQEWFFFQAFEGE